VYIEEGVGGTEFNNLILEGSSEVPRLCPATGKGLKVVNLFLNGMGMGSISCFLLNFWLSISVDIAYFIQLLIAQYVPSIFSDTCLL